MNVKNQDKIIVIKYGGHALDDQELRASFIDDLKHLFNQDYRFVIVHGGGPHINALLKRLNIESQFENGLRVTTEATLDAVEMALCGQVNKELVRIFIKENLPAVGISGEDDHLLVCKQKDVRLGLVGQVTSVNPDLLLCLVQNNFLPVVAPLALDKEANLYNLNADTAAGAIAGALKAQAFILVSDVPGVLDARGSLFNFLSLDAINELKAENVISGGMIPKLEACQKALAEGCSKSFIMDGRKPGALSKFIRDGIILGTEINN